MKRLLVLVMALVISATSAFAADKSWPKKLVYGVIPTAAQSSMKDVFGPLMDHLQKELGIEVELQTSNDYAAVITGMQYKHLDCAYFGPKSYVEAAQRANAQALVLEVAQDGSKGYYGYIITKKDSGLKSLDSLKGKTWAFTDPNSTSGTLVPSVLFGKKNIDPQQYFSKVIYSGSHEASIISVKNGKVDAAATNDLDFMRGLGKHWEENEFNIIWKSDLIPASPMACRGDLPASLKKAVAKALVSFKDKEGLDKLKISGYTPTTDKTYDTIRDLIEVGKKLKG